MKKLIVLASLLISGSAFADQSWDQLLSDNSIQVQAPFAGIFGDSGILNACVSGDNFFNVAPVKYCARSVEEKQRVEDEFGGREETVSYCAEYAYKNVNLSRHFGKDVCTEWKQVQNDDTFSWVCTKSTFVEAIHGLSYDIPVYRRSDEGSFDYAYSKNFQVPACSK
jgi:hypothetical protein